LFEFVNERDAPPVAVQPEVLVLSWRVFQLNNGDRHLFAILDSGSLRMTSALASFNVVRGMLTTKSGRHYKLCGPPEEGTVQLAMMHAYALRAGLLDPVDVSDELWAQTDQPGNGLLPT
jgi:hypothetical protein